MGNYESSTRNHTADRRIRKTRVALKKSLTTLLQQKSVKDISVKELTELADVNRGTFYLHYRDVFDLLEQSEQDLFDELSQQLDKIPAEALRATPYRPFEIIYSLCRENADFISILLGENGDIKFLKTMNTFFRERCLKDWGDLIREKQIADFDLFFSFLVGGCSSLVQHWFATGMKQSPRELAETTVKLLNRSIL